MTGTIKIERYENGQLIETETQTKQCIDISHWKAWAKWDNAIGAKSTLETRNGFMYRYTTHEPYGTKSVIYTRTQIDFIR